jgi:hypothetical protein
MKPKQIDFVGLLLIGAAVWVALSGGGLPWPSVLPGPSTPPLVVLMYEADHGPLPSYALGAANELNAAGREVRLVDDDTLTGTGVVPAWLKPAIEPGRAIMGSGQLDDALIQLSGDRVLKAVKLPADKTAILEAVK